VLSDTLLMARGRVASDTAQDADASLVMSLKALADPRRLSILDMLMGGVQCNCEIAARLNLSLSLVSYHLRILSEAGLVRSEPDPDDARWSYYSIDEEALEALRRSMARLLDGSRIRPRHPSCGPRGSKDCC